MKTTSVRLASLLLLTALGSLFLPAGCASTCGDISQVSNTSSGSFQYAPAGGGGDERVSRGPLPPSSLEVDSTGSESFTITGYFTDGAMLSHDFTLILANVSGGSNGPIADGSTLWFADCSHRPSHESCMTTRAPGLQDGGGMSFCVGQSGSCTSDSECPATSDAGVNGRCTPSEEQGPAIGCPSCQYDQCATDSECGAGSVCACGGSASTGRYPNGCLAGNCQVDSDCGPGGFCSPDVGFCGEGTVGYYCHTAGDQCHNDADCQNDPNSFGGQCVYDTSKKIWDCQGEACPG
jgi:hypothetical protein